MLAHFSHSDSDTTADSRRIVHGACLYMMSTLMGKGVMTYMYPESGFMRTEGVSKVQKISLTSFMKCPFNHLLLLPPFQICDADII